MSCWMNYQSKNPFKNRIPAAHIARLGLSFIWMVSVFWPDIKHFGKDQLQANPLESEYIVNFFFFCQNTYLDSYHNTTLVHFLITTLDIINLVGFTGKTKWTRRSCEVSCIIHCYPVYGRKKITTKVHLTSVKF